MIAVSTGNTYHDDLNTVLIFVSFPRYCVLVSADNNTFWPDFGCGFRLYRLCSEPNSAGLQPNEFHSPRYVAQCHLRDPLQHRGSNSHRPRSSNCRSPGGIIQHSGEFLTCSVPCDAREVAAQLISGGFLTSHNRHRKLKVSGMISRRSRVVMSSCH